MKLLKLKFIIPHLAQTGNLCPVRDKISVGAMQFKEPKSRMGRNRLSDCEFNHSVPDDTCGCGADDFLPIFNPYGIVKIQH